MKRRDASRRGGRSAGDDVGVTNLFRAFIEYVVRDLAEKPVGKKKKMHRASAVEWLEDVHADGPFSLTGVAGWIGVTPGALARRIRQEAAELEHTAFSAPPSTRVRKPLKGKDPNPVFSFEGPPLGVAPAWEGGPLQYGLMAEITWEMWFRQVVGAPRRRKSRRVSSSGQSGARRAAAPQSTA